MRVTKTWDSCSTFGLPCPIQPSHFLSCTEDDRNITSKNLHARLTLIRNAKLQAEIVDKIIIKQFPNMPGQWIAAAQYILFSTVSSYLQAADHHELERDTTLTEARDRIRHSVLDHTARIIAEIDTYPDIANLENWYQSHDQLRKLFDYESKKCCLDKNDK
jgi:hypothetical protein